MTTRVSSSRTWWHRGRAFTLAEYVCDIVVHGIGLFLALTLGTVLLVLAGIRTAPAELPALILYVATLIAVLTVSLVFNVVPVNGFKRVMARLDQATIFLFIAGTYTPFLAVVGAAAGGQMLFVLVWSAAIVGIALKLIVPQHFGRLAILLYLCIGWSGVLVFRALATALPPMAFWFLIAGGLAYTAGIVFHLWERLKFQNVLWHVFVVAGSMLHLWAIFDCMVLSRL